MLYWISRCWADGVTLDRLHNTDNFDLLDQSLPIGMLKMIEASKDKGSVLLADLFARRRVCLNRGNLLPGRVVVKLFLDSFKTMDDTPFFTDPRHLENIESHHSL